MSYPQQPLTSRVVSSDHSDDNASSVDSRTVKHLIDVSQKLFPRKVALQKDSWMTSFKTLRAVRAKLQDGFLQSPILTYMDARPCGAVGKLSRPARPVFKNLARKATSHRDKPITMTRPVSVLAGGAK